MKFIHRFKKNFFKLFHNFFIQIFGTSLFLVILLFDRYFRSMLVKSSFITITRIKDIINKDHSVFLIHPHLFSSEQGVKLKCGFQENVSSNIKTKCLSKCNTSGSLSYRNREDIVRKRHVHY